MTKYVASLSTDARRDAFRSMRGKILRTELYALDGTTRQSVPYTVTEHVYGVREESLPPPTDPDRLHIFYPLALSQRTTQWERGRDPLSVFSFTDNCVLSGAALQTADFDAYGQPMFQVSVAVGRSRAFQLPASPGNSYLVAQTANTYAQRDDVQLYIVDRISSSTTYAISNDGRHPV